MTEFISKEKALERLDALLTEIQAQGSPCYLTEGGQAKAVLLDVDRYNAMMDALEEKDTAADREANLALIGNLIESEARRRKKSIRFFGLSDRSREID